MDYISNENYRPFLVTPVPTKVELRSTSNEDCNSILERKRACDEFKKQRRMCVQNLDLKVLLSNILKYQRGKKTNQEPIQPSTQP
ncbi:uncharacterized protein LOC143150747 isoform X4 [Ptiloglossa arizonensis]|uniref:uncharacterized protein LOC143150747 isoform X4 n=1 Tax=Ptiloglossa arizonensis TaxID=3350558 RepID=UPI003F9F2D39